ncbi:MAG: 1,6-anhydro-N-acetylmuramyl-L-alanine amidase AmpD [Magnetococcus sp. WYHC-3]
MPSPHWDLRPPGVWPDLLVVHAISLPPGGRDTCHIDDLFLGRLDPTAHACFPAIAALRLSAHFLIDRAGVITQYVPILKRAWHAGVSRWEGRENCNDFAIGVELLGDEQTPFETVQYQQLGRLFVQLQMRLPGLTRQRIKGHEHVAPGRKWDPGPMFDWSLLEDTLDHATAAPPWPLWWE